MKKICRCLTDCEGVFLSVRWPLPYRAGRRSRSLGLFRISQRRPGLSECVARGHLVSQNARGSGGAGRFEDRRQMRSNDTGT